jgi:hypothetical protein
VIDVENIDDEKLDELLSASFDGSLDASEQDVMRLACQHRDNAERVVGWLKLEAAMRSQASPSVAASLAKALQTRGHDRWRPKGANKRWVAAALLVVVGAASAAAYFGRRVTNREGANHSSESRGPAKTVGNPLPVFVAEENETALSHPETLEEIDSSLPDEVSPRTALEDGVLARYDFETGKLPSEFKNGQIVEPATVRAGSRFAAQGMREKYATNVASVVFMPDWALSYDESIVIQFLYFSESASRIRMQIYNHDQRQNYQFDLPEVQRGQWTAAEISLANMRPVRDTVRRMVTGDRLTIVYLMGGRADASAIMIDDLTVRRR